VTPSWTSPIAWLASVVIATASRVIDQFNLPLTAQEAKEGMSNEVVHLRDRQNGERKETCWLRRFSLWGTNFLSLRYDIEAQATWSAKRRDDVAEVVGPNICGVA
jgi:hypothetical protein